jgi:hypothetical protein
VSRKPPVGNAHWDLCYAGKVEPYNPVTREYEKVGAVRVYLDDNLDNDPYLSFFKVVIDGKRPKYFYGEYAYSDTERYVSDNGGVGGCLS